MAAPKRAADHTSVNCSPAVASLTVTSPWLAMAKSVSGTTISSGSWLQAASSTTAAEKMYFNSFMSVRV